MLTNPQVSINKANMGAQNPETEIVIHDAPIISHLWASDKYNVGLVKGCLDSHWGKFFSILSGLRQ